MIMPTSEGITTFIMQFTTRISLLEGFFPLHYDSVIMTLVAQNNFKRSELPKLLYRVFSGTLNMGRSAASLINNNQMEGSRRTAAYLQLISSSFTALHL